MTFIVPLLSATSALFMCWLFASATWHKSSQPRAFSKLVGEHLSVARSVLTDLLTLGVILTECLIAIMIVVPSSRPIGATLAIALLFAYMLLIARGLYLQRAHLDCGCATGASDIKISAHLLARNTVLIAIAALCVLPTQATWYSHMFALPLAALMVILYQSCELLIANAQKLNAEAASYT